MLEYPVSAGVHVMDAHIIGLPFSSSTAIQEPISLYHMVYLWVKLC